MGSLPNDPPLAGLEVECYFLILRGGIRAEKLRRGRSDCTEDYRKGKTPMGIEKILPLEQAYKKVDELKQQSLRVVLTNGCFDLLHPGHTRLFAEARKLGDVLIVAMNSDRSVCALKGSNRALQPERERAEIIAAMAAVDYVTIFDDESVLSVVKRMLPDVLVKGAAPTCQSPPRGSCCCCARSTCRLPPTTIAICCAMKRAFAWPNGTTPSACATCAGRVIRRSRYCIGAHSGDGKSLSVRLARPLTVECPFMNYVPINGLRMLAVESGILFAAFVIAYVSLRFLHPEVRQPGWSRGYSAAICARWCW